MLEALQQQIHQPENCLLVPIFSDGHANSADTNAVEQYIFFIDPNYIFKTLSTFIKCYFSSTDLHILN